MLPLMCLLETWGVQTFGECCPLSWIWILYTWVKVCKWTSKIVTNERKTNKQKKTGLLPPALVIYLFIFKSVLLLFLPGSSFHPILSSFHLPSTHLTIHFQVSLFCEPHESYLFKWHDVHAHVTRFSRCAFLSHLSKSKAYLFMFHKNCLKQLMATFSFRITLVLLPWHLKSAHSSHTVVLIV